MNSTKRQEEFHFLSLHILVKMIKLFINSNMKLIKILINSAPIKI